MYWDSSSGSRALRASWTPNYPYEIAESTKMLSVNTFDEQNVFSVVSNSTVSALVFNSTTNELSFTVSGPDGTIGFVDLTIAKNLIENIADLGVYLDGTSLSYTATSTADSWLLHFTYTHSTHAIVVNLKSAIIPEFSPWLFLVLIPTILLFEMFMLKKTRGKFARETSPEMYNKEVYPILLGNT
jgi:hypothetical protein